MCCTSDRNNSDIALKRTTEPLLVEGGTVLYVCTFAYLLVFTHVCVCARVCVGACVCACMCVREGECTLVCGSMQKR